MDCIHVQQTIQQEQEATKRSWWFFVSLELFHIKSLHQTVNLAGPSFKNNHALVHCILLEKLREIFQISASP